MYNQSFSWVLVLHQQNALFSASFVKQGRFVVLNLQNWLLGFYDLSTILQEGLAEWVYDFRKKAILILGHYVKWLFD